MIKAAEVVKKAPKPNRGGGSIILAVRLNLLSRTVEVAVSSGGCALFTLALVAFYFILVIASLFCISPESRSLTRRLTR